MPNRTAIRAAAALAALLAQGPAASAAPLVEVGPNTVVPLVRIQADELVGLDVTDAYGKLIGGIDGVFGPTPDEASALSIEFDHAVVPDDEDRLVPITSLTLDGLNIVVPLDPAAIAALPKAPE